MTSSSIHEPLLSIRLSVVCAFGLLLGSMNAPLADPLFPNPVNLVGSDPFFVTALDVNNDGKMDLATANFDFGAKGGVSILLGNGDGSFEPEQRFPAGDLPAWIAFGDLNGDGNLDLAVTNYLSEDVSILLGHGDGSFGPQTRIHTGSLPFAVAIADLNSDGRQDLVVSNNGSGYLTYTPGNGDGTFGQQHQIFGVLAPAALTVGDFDENGALDFAVTDDQKNTVSVYMGEGDGRFRDPQEYATGLFPESITRTDLNGDGHTDLAVANANSGSVTVLAGEGNGSFHAMPSLTVGEFPLCVAAADFTGDGRIDLVTTNARVYFEPSGGDLSLLEGRGDGTFLPERRMLVGPGPMSAAFAEFNGDAGLDLVVVGPMMPQGPTVFLHLRNGMPEPDPLKLAGGIPEVVLVEDFDEDGIQDLLTDTPARLVFEGSLRFHKGNGDGTYSGGTNVLGEVFSGVASGDFNQDGHTDLVVKLVYAGNSLYVGLGDGHGAFRFVATGITTTSMTGNVVAGDFDGDGDADIAVSPTTFRYGFPFPVPGYVYLNNGGGASWTEHEFPTGVNPQNLIRADLNHDGLSDLVVTNNGEVDCDMNSCFITRAGVVVNISNGNGTFDSTTLAVPHGVLSVAVGDVNGDGNPDLAIASSDIADFSPGEITLFLGRGDATFASAAAVPCPEFRPIGIAMNDFDGDEKMDLAVRGFRGFYDQIMVFRGNNDGSFRKQVIFLNDFPRIQDGMFAGVDRSRMFDKDLDRDGRVDLIFPLGDGLGIFLNYGPFPNHPPLAAAVVQSPVECTSLAGALVTLDGSDSTDPDSTPGTQDDIVSFEWFEDFGMQSERLLGSGALVTVPLPLGGHEIILKVTDKRGVSSTAEAFVAVLDTTPPSLSINANPAILWPPNHRMVEVTAALIAHDACGAAHVVLASVASSEPDDAPGGADGATTNDIQEAGVGTDDRAFMLRAERAAQSPGRAYTLSYLATDDSGNAMSRAASIVVPHDRGGVTEPLSITVEETANGTVLRWDPVTGALFYNTVRGDVTSLRETVEQIGLGPLTCLEHRSIDASTTGDEDRQTPSPGKAFFYLVEFNDGLDSSFGSEDVKKPRIKGSGGCGSSGRLTATGE